MIKKNIYTLYLHVPLSIKINLEFLLSAPAFCIQWDNIPGINKTYLKQKISDTYSYHPSLPLYLPADSISKTCIKVRMS